MKNWWSERPFDVQGSLTVPVFSFDSAEFANKSIGKISSLHLRSSIINLQPSFT